MKDQPREPFQSIKWSTIEGFSGLALMDAHHCVRDWKVFIESLTFCVVHRAYGHSARNRYRGWTYDVRPGQVQVFEAGEWHRCEARGSAGDYSVLWVPNEIARLAPDERGRDQEHGGFRRFRVPEIPNVYGSFVHLINVLTSPGASRLEMEVALVETLGNAVRSTGNVVSQVPYAERFATRARVRRALEFVEDELRHDAGRKITLADLVQVSGARTPFDLCHEFRLALGVSPCAFVRVRRLCRGALLLGQGVAVKDAAAQCGYTLSTFSRQYHRQFGAPPSVFRLR